jgi:hypothetical protein
LCRSKLGILIIEILSFLLFLGVLIATTIAYSFHDPCGKLEELSLAFIIFGYILVGISLIAGVCLWILK